MAPGFILGKRSTARDLACTTPQPGNNTNWVWFYIPPVWGGLAHRTEACVSPGVTDRTLVAKCAQPRSRPDRPDECRRSRQVFDRLVAQVGAGLARHVQPLFARHQNAPVID